MMTEILQWGQFVGLIGVFCIIIYLPGLWLTYLAGERGALAWAVAPALTLTVTTLASLNASWSLRNYGWYDIFLTLAIVSPLALATGILSGKWSILWRAPSATPSKPGLWERQRTLRKRNRRRQAQQHAPKTRRLGEPTTPPPEPTGNLKLALLTGLAVATVTLGRIAYTIKHPWAPSQTYDAVYHLNALAMIRDVGRASPFDMDLSTPIYMGKLFPTWSSFYPNAWHQVASLVTPWISDIPTVANAWTVTILIVIWPLSIGTFIWVISFGSWRLTATAVLLSQALPQFPQMFFTFGTLYPNLLGFAMVPAITALGYDILHHRLARASLSGTLVAIMAAPGLLVAHPLTIILIAFSATGIIGSWLANHLLPREQRLQAARLLLAAALTTVLVIGIYYAATKVPHLAKMQEYDPGGWLPSSANPLIAAIKAGTLAGGTWFARSFWGSAVLGAIALYGAWEAAKKPRWHSLILIHVLMVTLFIIADGDWNQHRRAWLTGFFYSDPMRFAAMIAISALPLIIIGVDRLGLTAMKYLSKTSTINIGIDTGDQPSPRRLYPRIVVTIAVISQILPGYFALGQQTQQAYGLSQDGSGQVGMLTVDEYQLLKRVGHTVPAGDTVMGNPWTGAAYVWALADRRAVFPSLSGYTGDEDVFLATATNTLKREPQGCLTIANRRAYWVLDFGNHYLWGGDDPSERYRYYYGLEKLPQSHVAQVVDSQGEAKLLRITACEADEK